MSHYTLNYPTLKEMEKSLFHLLQVTFDSVEVLQYIDGRIGKRYSSSGSEKIGVATEKTALVYEIQGNAYAPQMHEARLRLRR